MANFFEKIIQVGAPIVGGLIGGPVGAAIGSGVSSLIGQNQQEAAINRANESAQAASDRALALQERMYEEGVARQQPYYQAGVNALAQMQGQTGAMPAAFQYRPEQLTTDPGYGFRLQEGLKALERSAAARGGLMSGATGKALQRYGQDMASQEYGNAYNRALTEYNALRQRESEGYNRLAGLAGVGGTTAQQITSAGQNYANRAGGIGMEAADISGQAALARAGSYGRTAGDIAQLAGRYFTPQSLNALAPSFSQTYLGGSGFGTGLAYGNQDIGQFI